MHEIDMRMKYEVSELLAVNVRLSRDAQISPSAYTCAQKKVCRIKLQRSRAL